MNLSSFSILAAAATPAASESNLPLWELLKAGGWVMYPLLLASLIATFLILLLLQSLKKDRVTTPEFSSKAEGLIRDKNLAGLLDTCRSSPILTARVVEQTAEFIQKNPTADFTAIREVAQAEGSRQAAQLHQQTVYLMDIGVIAPMLGLFGTVVGILRSFGSIASEATPMRTMLLAGGVSQALVATAAGLIIGITCMFFYSWFRGKTQTLISDLEASSTNLVVAMGLNFKK